MTQTGSFANKILDIVTRRNLKFLKKAAAKYKLKTCELNIALRVIEKKRMETKPLARLLVLESSGNLFTRPKKYEVHGR